MDQFCFREGLGESLPPQLAPGDLPQFRQEFPQQRVGRGGLSLHEQPQSFR
jgi:hypothetical protein